MSTAKIAPRKIEYLGEIKDLLTRNENFVLTAYSGLKVSQLVTLRAEVRAKNSQLKVIKNNLFRRALQESDKHKELAEQLDPMLKGPVAVVFSGSDLPAVSKTLVDFSKKEEKLQVKAGFMDGRILAKNEVIQIASLPSRDELLAKIAGSLNTPVTQIASGINQIMSGLARAIKAVGEKNG